MIVVVAATTFLLSMFNVNTRGIQTSNVIVGMAIFAGGLLQFIAGMWEFPRGNIFGATGKISNDLHFLTLHIV